jgi:hypothetical protein
VFERKIFFSLKIYGKLAGLSAFSLSRVGMYVIIGLGVYMYVNVI